MVESFGNQDLGDGVQYRICKARSCPVVYFADEPDQQFHLDVIRKRPSFEPDADAAFYPLHDCFGYDREHIRQDIEENGETNIDDWIAEHVQTEGCACRWKSPLGGCRLGNVKGTTDELRNKGVN